MHEIPSKFPSQMINSSENPKKISAFSCLGMEGSLARTEMRNEQRRGLNLSGDRRSDDEAFSFSAFLTKANAGDTPCIM